MDEPRLLTRKKGAKNVPKAEKPQTIKIHIKKLGSRHVQWNPVHTVTNGAKKKLAVLTGGRINEGF